MTADELTALLVAAPEPLDDATKRLLIDGAVALLDQALRLSLDVCDALDDGFRTEYGTAAGLNMPELLRSALSAIAEELGDEEELVRHRPGSWEAEHVRRLGMVYR